jgi:hypothetical protein
MYLLLWICFEGSGYDNAETPIKKAIHSISQELTDNLKSKVPRRHQHPSAKFSSARQKKMTRISNNGMRHSTITAEKQ